ncbi:MAG: ABC transporter permease [Lachnospiraceae bacterium]|nr:ABC transporter permease [Lachnospiraceae bacterium]
MKNGKLKKQSQLLEILKRLAKNKAAMVGLFIIIVMAVIAAFAPLIAPYRYDEANFYNIFQPFSKEHLLGTDQLGRDILSRLIYGARYSLKIGIYSVAMAATAGAVIGSIAGYFGGVVDDVIMRILDIVNSIPGLVLSIAVAAILGPGFTNCIIALALGTTPMYARMIRASILNIRKMEYLEAATSINCSSARIIFRHILPNAISPLIVLATMSVAQAILTAASLSFIGLGVQPPEPEWGAMLADARTHLRQYPRLVLVPGITIMIAVLSLNILGDGLRDAMDPKLKD